MIEQNLMREREVQIEETWGRVEDSLDRSIVDVFRHTCDTLDDETRLDIAYLIAPDDCTVVPMGTLWECTDGWDNPPNVDELRDFVDHANTVTAAGCKGEQLVTETVES